MSWPHEPIRLLDAQRVHGVIARVARARGPAPALDQRVVDAGGELRGHVELPAELADVRDARGAHAAPRRARSRARSGYGNAASDRSASVRRARSSRERGPITPSTAVAPVTSVSTARASPRFRRIQSASCVAAAAAVTTRYASSREARHGQVALDAAVAVQHLRVDDAPDGHVHVVGAEPLERGRARPAPRAGAWRTTTDRTARPPRAPRDAPRPTRGNQFWRPQL